MANFCSGSGTFATSAVLERRHAIAIDCDKLQDALLATRLQEIQHRVKNEHKRVTQKAASRSDFDHKITTWNWLDPLDTCNPASGYIKRQQKKPAAKKKKSGKEEKLEVPMVTDKAGEARLREEEEELERLLIAQICEESLVEAQKRKDTLLVNLSFIY